MMVSIKLPVEDQQQPLHQQMKFLGAELRDQEDKYHWTVNKQKPENKQFDIFLKCRIC